MADSTNRVHVSPGVYTSETVDMKAAANSLGVTKLAVVGETLKGPAFQPYWISSQKEFNSVFGGTSTEKFRETNYPKYELPYIANEYLTKSNQLCVVKTLGLSGYNAGPAWLITGQKSTDPNKKYAIAVLRSRGSYKFRGGLNNTVDTNGCGCQKAYDSITYNVGEISNVASCTAPRTYNMSAVTISSYISLSEKGSSCTSYAMSGTSGNSISVSTSDLGRFTINIAEGFRANNSTPTSADTHISVSLNKTDKDYILNVLGTSNSNGTTPIYVESLYDVAWQQLVENGDANQITTSLTGYNAAFASDYECMDSIDGILTTLPNALTSKELGKRYLYATGLTNASPSGVTCYNVSYGTDASAIGTCVNGTIYTVIKNMDTVASASTYAYRSYTNTSGLVSGTTKIKIDDKLIAGSSTDRHGAAVYNNEDGFYYKLKDTATVTNVTCDLNDYKSSFRYSSTPWIVSNAKGDAKNIQVNKLFRFHTISDGAASVDEVKVSIENIRPDTGEFDVVVRSYYDTDSSVSVLERFSKCTMSEGKSFIAYKIGTLDGEYENKSKYITVEVATGSGVENSIPAGFLGYTIPNYNGSDFTSSHSGVTLAPIVYNKKYDEDKPKKKQYFGISDISGYDVDYFTYKGKMASIEDSDYMTHCFHLDCRVNTNSYNSGSAPSIKVDDESGYIFDTVGINERTTNYSEAPIIASESEMEGCIYEDIKLRKFTLVFAGGFDGWDVYRNSRTNTDSFAYTTYKGYINNDNGTGYAFDKLYSASLYGIEGNAITSDYYSTLAGVSLLKNPEEVDINLLATPGIDIINNSKLVQETFNILEDRADTFYIVATPDKESGSGDYADEVPEVSEVVDNFTGLDLHSDYAATYYPWVKIEDNGSYLWIPATRDVVRNMAESDNSNTTMNLAPAGLTRGKVSAIRARKNLKLAECDELYDANINPVRTYAQEGVVIMGQKTLRESDDLLNRIDVRRCVLRMRKLIAIGTLGLIFEPNDNSTVKSFKSIVSGIMEGFVKNRAISNWRMDVDDSDEARDRLEIPATIYIKPIRALEYISINFVVTNNGAYFED